MRLRGIGRPLVLLAVHFVALAGSTPAETAPGAVDLGTLGGTLSVALAVNASGQVVG